MASIEEFLESLSYVPIEMKRILSLLTELE